MIITVKTNTEITLVNNKPSMRVRGLIMRADGDKGSREMEAELRPDCNSR